MKDDKRIYWLFAGLGIELVGIELTMIWLGKYLDGQLGLNGVCIAVLGLSGLVFWLVHVLCLTRQLEKDE